VTKRFVYSNQLGIIGLCYLAAHFSPKNILLGEIGIELSNNLEDIAKSI